MNIDTIIVKFDYKEQKLEIFGQTVPVQQQYAYRHMLVEYRLLRIGGKMAIEEIKKLKNKGYKTEPAFAHHFQITGDPYQILYDLYPLSDENIKHNIIIP
jgi:hypothetical protein